MDMPGFSASASLHSTERRARREAADEVVRGRIEVLAQSKADPSGRADAEHVRDVLGFGQVHCEWFDYCEGRMPNIHCGIRQICYWWPY
jgi:hypothetical protein